MHVIHGGNVGDPWTWVDVALHLEDLIPGEVGAVEAAAVTVVTYVEGEEEVLNEVPNDEQEDRHQEDAYQRRVESL